MRPLRSSLSAFAAGLLCLATACHADEAAPAELPELGLMGTIPIYWGESDDFGQLLSDEGEVHWARAQLEAGYRLRLLDMLSEESLAGLEVLMLAQPRALSPQENVALDTWVRRGGKLLLFADPLLTGAAWSSAATVGAASGTTSASFCRALVRMMLARLTSSTIAASPNSPICNRCIACERVPASGAAGRLSRVERGMSAGSDAMSRSLASRD